MAKDFKYYSRNGICYDPCTGPCTILTPNNTKNNPVMIGSVACQLCAHFKNTNLNNNTITCPKIMRRDPKTHKVIFFKK